LIIVKYIIAVFINLHLSGRVSRESLMKIYHPEDLPADGLAGSTVAVVGYGNQGHAHALNLRDSGLDVVVGARTDGRAWRRARADGFEPVVIPEAVASADCVAVLLPDEIQARVFEQEIRPSLRAGTALVFAHGFTVAFGLIHPPEGYDVVLVAPKGQGHFLRKIYNAGQSLPCLLAVEQDASGLALERAIAYAGHLGCLSAGAIETSFKEEAVTDLFGEQVVLCGGVPALVTAAFETLVGRGYRPEVAYLECLHELKIITDLMYSGGIAAMKGRISRTAAWGSFVTGDKMVPPAVRRQMEKTLTEIETGEFAAGWSKEAAGGLKTLSTRLAKERRHAIETAGERVRALMKYLKEAE
jgi:ketol-acid reductoisomerase